MLNIRRMLRDREIERDRESSVPSVVMLNVRRMLRDRKRECNKDEERERLVSRTTLLNQVKPVELASRSQLNWPREAG